MSSNITGINSLSYKGVEASSPPNLVIISRAPTSNDYKNFRLGDLWLNPVSKTSYQLTNVAQGVATWTTMATSTAGLQTMVSDSGTATVTGTAMNVLGGELLNTTGAGASLTINVDRGTNGQLMVGATSATAAWADLTSTGGTVTISKGANTLNIEASGSVALQFDGDSGSATPTLGVVDVVGGANITTSCATNVVTIVVSGTTDHAIQVGNASGSISDIPVGTDGEVLTGLTGFDPSFMAVGSYSALTDHGVVLGQGNLAFNVTAVGTDGQTLTGNGAAADPTFESIGTKSTLTQYGTLMGGGAGAFTATAAGTDGQVLVSATAGPAAFATLTSTGGTITFTPGTNTLNLESVGAGTGLTWSEVAGVSTALAVMNGYILNNGALVTGTLPAVAAVGEVIAIVGKGAGGWLVAQRAGQTIHLLSTDTTTGVAGSLASTQQYDCLELVCIIANTDFVVRSSMGNLTVA